MLIPEIKIYNLRIVPSQPVFNEVVGFKKRFRDVFGNQPLSKSKPHITLAIFEMDTRYEDILIEVFDQLSIIGKFELDIEGFGIFKGESNTLILNVPKTKDIERLHTQLKILWSRDLHRKKALTLSSTPHITISKTNDTGMLHTSFELFQKTDYSKRIQITHLTLVSRYKGKTWDWEHHIALL